MSWLDNSYFDSCSPVETTQPLGLTRVSPSSKPSQLSDLGQVSEPPLALMPTAHRGPSTAFMSLPCLCCLHCIYGRHSLHTNHYCYHQKAKKLLFQELPAELLEEEV